MPKRNRDRDLVDELQTFPINFVDWRDENLTEDEIADCERQDDYARKREAWYGTDGV